MSELVKSSVKFNELAHTYTTADGVPLVGVTTVLGRTLFPDKYAGISPEILQKAADYGSMIHEAIELYESIGATPDDKTVIDAYRQLIEREDFKVLATEYLISDNSYLASSIDLVGEDYSLADIKTTSHLDLDYISWQLSVYAYLFELQNPDKQVNALYAIWLPKPQYGTPKMVEVYRHPTAEVAEMIDADKLGVRYNPQQYQLQTISTGDMAEIDQLEQSIRRLKSLQERYEQLKQKVLSEMLANNIDKCFVGNVQFSVKQGYDRVVVDTKLLKESYPSAYNFCKKITSIKPSLTIKIN